MLYYSKFTTAAAANEWVWLTYDNVLANLLPGKEPQISVGYDIWWAMELGWAQWQIQKNENGTLVIQPIVIQFTIWTIMALQRDKIQVGNYAMWEENNFLLKIKQKLCEYVKNSSNLWSPWWTQSLHLSLTFLHTGHDTSYSGVNSLTNLKKTLFIANYNLT